ncbi:MAG TPA: cupin domain-containing protein, partial [Acidimicrobiia bacterium]|nr:cupin domain-containing protein [Acidimicrobiia bacterium]
MSTRTPIGLGDIEIRFLVEADDSHGAATVFECQVRPDAQVPAAHSHDGFEETVYGLAGVTTFSVDGDTRELGVGD